MYTLSLASADGATSHEQVVLFVIEHVPQSLTQLLALLPLRLLPVPRARHELQLLQPLPLRLAQRRVQASVGTVQQFY